MPAASPTILLSALREILDKDAQACRWETEFQGIQGRVLLQPAGRSIRFTVSLPEPMRLSGRVQLPPVEWCNGDGAVLVTVEVERAGGVKETIWSAEVRSAHELGDKAGVSVDALVPADAVLLALRTEQLRAATPFSVGRAAWIEVGLSLPDEGAERRSELNPAPGRSTVPGAARSGRGNTLAGGPCISIVTPVHNPPVEMLVEAVESVLAQTYRNWQLCLCDDGSTDAEVIEKLRDYAASDERIVLSRNEVAGGISAASNVALAMATGDFIALLDHDDTLEPDALEQVVAALTADPTLDMVYTDESIVAADGRRLAEHIKPDWSPDTARTNCYTCHLGVYRRRIVEQVGGFRSEFDGSQDFDLILRFTEQSDRIAHIPRLLYNWRAHAGSAAGGIDAKPYAYVAGHRAAAAHVERVGLSADVQYGPPGIFRIVHRVPPGARVAVVVADGSPSELADLGSSLLAQRHQAWELSLSLPADRLAEAVAALHGVGVSDDRIVAVTATDRATDRAGRAAALNSGAAASGAPYLLLLESPIVGLTGDWLLRLLGYAGEPGVAASAPVVADAQHRIMHVGLATPDGTPLHLLYGEDASRAQAAATNVIAVDTVMATSRETFERLGGLDAGFESLSFVDYSLRAIDEGMRIVAVTDARVRASGFAVVNDIGALMRLRRRRLARPDPDPYFNRAYHCDRGDYRLANTEAEFGDVDDGLLALS